MRWEEIKTEKGILKYRMPNIVEGYDFLSMMDQGTGASGIFKVKARFIEKMAPLIDFSACGYASYNDLLEDKSNMMQPLSQIADKIFDDIASALKKKD